MRVVINASGHPTHSGINVWLSERGREPTGLQHAHHLDRPPDDGLWPDHIIDLAHLPGGTPLRKAFRDRRGGDTGHRHAMGHDMVRVPVAAVGIVGDHHLRTVPPDQGHQAAGHVLERRLHKRLALLVTGPAGHARIVIAELVHVGHAQQGRGLGQFFLADQGQALPVCGILTRVEPQARNLDLAEVPMRAGDDNGRMALLGGEAEQAPRTTRFIVGMRMHHHEGMGFPGHRLLVCEPPHPRSGARSHGPATPAAVGHGGACVADGGRSHGGAQHLVAAHQARASTGDTLEATILASWSTLPCCEARGVMMADGATPQPAWLGVAGATPSRARSSSAFLVAAPRAVLSKMHQVGTVRAAAATWAASASTAALG